MNGLMIGLALLEGIIAIISASICCGPLCCPGGSSGVKLLKFQLTVLEKFMKSHKLLQKIFVNFICKILQTYIAELLKTTFRSQEKLIFKYQ